MIYKADSLNSTENPRLETTTKDGAEPFCDKCGQDFGMAERLAEAEKAIAIHNAECDRLCNDKKNCGYAPYKRSCPQCPKDWKIEVGK